MKKYKFSNQAKEIKAIEDHLNFPEDIDLSTGFPNQDKMIKCGKLLLKYLNSSKQKGVFCVVQILNTERSYLYGGATQNLMLWKKILECISSYLPANAYLGRVSIGIAIHAWGDDLADNFIQSISDFSTALENNHFEEVSLVGGVDPFLATKTGYLFYPEDIGYTDDFVVVSRYTALTSAEITSELMQSTVKRFSYTLLEKADDYVSSEVLLIDSLSKQNFFLYFQAQHNLITNEITGAEALCRWDEGELSLSKTYEYICILENSRYITKFTESTFIKLVDFFKTNQIFFRPGFQLAFNVSPSVFKWPKFNLFEMIKSEVDKTPLLASHLTIEITESAYTNKSISDIAVSNLRKVKELGIRISIDDFGSGYGALKLLASNIPTCIKLDKDLTIEFCSTDTSEQSYIKNLIQTANISNLSVLSEGIETLAQKEFLIKHGIFSGQGYLYSKPLPENEFVSYLKKSY